MIRTLYVFDFYRILDKFILYIWVNTKRHAIVKLTYRVAYKITMKQGIEAFIDDKLEDDVTTDAI